MEALKDKRHVNLIVVHCSDSPDDRDVRAADIDRWHKERGFVRIGYHFVICKDGIIETGRGVNSVGAHCLGHNLFSIGICWTGRKDCNARQRHSLIKTIADMLTKYNLKSNAVKGHCEIDKHKTCPNLDMDDLRADVERYLKGKL